MDLMKIMRSLEEFLYEVMSWVLFYPMTLWRTARHPREMMTYAAKELERPPEDQYVDSISPPLFLMLTLGLCHIAELASHEPLPDAGASIMGALLHSPENLLLLRSLLFAVFPLALADAQLHYTGIALSRATLRGPFFGQCFVTALFALVSSLSATLMRTESVVLQSIGLAGVSLGCVAYLAVEAAWFRQTLNASAWRGLRVATIAFLKAAVLVIIVILVIGAAPAALT